MDPQKQSPLEARRTFPDWEERYETQDVEAMPWFYQGLDPDVAAALVLHRIAPCSALDLGCGPGTQAIALSELGYNVVGSDLSKSAVHKATQRAAGQKGVRFVVDDVVQSRLTGPFGLILDRGCFHVLSPELRGIYVRTVRGLLVEGGTLMLKCFSDRETMEGGPYRFSQEQIRSLFTEFGLFSIVESKETVYQGQLAQMPLALFVVLKAT